MAETAEDFRMQSKILQLHRECLYSMYNNCIVINLAYEETNTSGISPGVPSDAKFFALPATRDNNWLGTTE